MCQAFDKSSCSLIRVRSLLFALSLSLIALTHTYIPNGGLGQKEEEEEEENRAKWNKNDEQLSWNTSNMCANKKIKIYQKIVLLTHEVGMRNCNYKSRENTQTHKTEDEKKVIELKRRMNEQKKEIKKVRESRAKMGMEGGSLNAFRRIHENSHLHIKKFGVSDIRTHTSTHGYTHFCTHRVRTSHTKSYKRQQPHTTSTHISNSSSSVPQEEKQQHHHHQHHHQQQQ